MGLETSTNVWHALAAAYAQNSQAREFALCCDLGLMRRDQSHIREHGDLRGSTFGLHPRGRRENSLCCQKRLFIVETLSLFL